MRLEIESAANFLSNLLRLHSSIMTHDQLDLFHESLLTLLTGHYKEHWFPEKPFKGSAYRCLRINHKMDPIIAKAGSNCGINEVSLREVLPNELTLWVDPKEVSYRIGENGSICILFESENKAKVEKVTIVQKTPPPVSSPPLKNSNLNRSGSPSGSLSSAHSSLSSSPSPSSSPDWCRSPEGSSSPYAQTSPGPGLLPPHRIGPFGLGQATFMPNSAAVAASLFNANLVANNAAAAQRMGNGQTMNGHWLWGPNAATAALYQHQQQYQRRARAGQKQQHHHQQVQQPQQYQYQQQATAGQQQQYGWDNYMDRPMTASRHHNSHLNVNLEQLAAYVSS